METLVIGSNGQLGSDLCREIEPSKLVALAHSEIEITSMDSVMQALQKHRPEVVINTAAYVRVDECETEPDKCFLVNALGSRNVAVAAEKIGAKLVYVSSDYVFGEESRTMPYTEFDVPAPVNILGKSKVEGENFVQHLCSRYFIIRTSGLFGMAGSSGKGGNFVETIIKLARERDELKVVNDQIFSPTCTRDLAKKVVQLINTEYYGIFHITGKKACSWYEFAREILKLAGVKTPVIPITSGQYPQKARRPGYSVLDNYHLKLLGMDDMRPWQEALTEYLKEKGHMK